MLLAPSSDSRMMSAWPGVLGSFGDHMQEYPAHGPAGARLELGASGSG